MDEPAAEHAPGGWRSSLSRRAAPLKSIGLVLVVAGLMLIARRLPVGQALASLEDRIRAFGVWGPLVFGLVYVVAVVAMVPGSVLTVAVGAMFGLGVGTATVSVASTTGAALAFLIARYLARESVERWVRRDPRFAAIDRAIGASGWKIVVLLRLSPAVPFNLQNYLYGLTAIGFWPCVLASWLAMLPGTFLYVYIGLLSRAGLEVAAGGGPRGRGPAEWAFTVVGLLATVAATVYVTHLARRAIRDQVGIIGSQEPATDPLG